jgi:hypothetical protein
MAQIDRHLARNCPILVTTLCLAALFTTGCDECPEGAVTCQGENGIRVCQRGNEDAKAVWSNFQCPVACRQVGTEVHCVDSREPVAECAMEAGSRPVCFSGQPAYCWHGYLDGAAPPACAPDTHCQMTPCGGSCVVGNAPDSRCSSGDSASFCDGNSRALCACGFEKSRDPCNTLLCHEMTMSISSPMGATTGYEARCLDSLTQDPRCGDPTQPASAFCDGDVVGNCWFGFARPASCPPSAPCKVVNASRSYATCSFPGQ